MPGLKIDGEQELVYHLHLGEPAMPDQPRLNYPILGFAAGTPILTATGFKTIEDLQPGDGIQTKPGCAPGDHEPDAPVDEPPRLWEAN